jgi:5'-phosphate synthase pdxT subunit
MLRGIGVEACEVRLPSELTNCDGLIIPGGESTTIGKVARAYGLMEPLRAYARAGHPVWGTCAGMILLASDIGRETPHLGLMDVKVQRNAFGRQVDSFEVDLAIAGSEALAREPFHAVFIRAPLIESVAPGVEVLARLPDGTIVAARQQNLLATSFHPELTRDGRVHEMFVERVNEETRRRVNLTG